MARLLYVVADVVIFVGALAWSLTRIAQGTRGERVEEEEVLPMLMGLTIPHKALRSVLTGAPDVDGADHTP